MHALFGTSAPYGLGSSLRLWLDARTLLGRASGAAITAPSNLQDAAWQKVNATAGSATQLVDTNDSGVPQSHMAVQYATNATLGTTFVFKGQLQAGTKTWARVALGSNSGAYINLSTGALGTVTNATCTVTNLGGGWWGFELHARPLAGNAGCVVLLANGDGAQSYAGDGTGTIFATGFAVYQQLVSGWPDWSGEASDLDEISTNKPIWTPGALDGSRPGVIISEASANWIGKGAGGITAILEGADKPFSYMITAKRGPALTVTEGELIGWNHTTGQSMNVHGTWWSNPPDIAHFKQDTVGGTGGGVDLLAANSDAPHIYQVVSNGTQISTWRTDTAYLSAAAFDAATSAHDLFTLGAMRALGAPQSFGNWTISEVRIWNEAISEAVRLRELATMKLKWGIA